jgi:hypothetical protein
MHEKPTWKIFKSQRAETLQLETENQNTYSILY